MKEFKLNIWVIIILAIVVGCVFKDCLEHRVKMKELEIILEEHKARQAESKKKLFW